MALDGMMIHACPACALVGSNDCVCERVCAQQCLQGRGGDLSGEGVDWRTRIAYTKSAFICIGSLPPQAT
jgi:hypothetical protein